METGEVIRGKAMPILTETAEGLSGTKPLTVRARKRREMTGSVPLVARGQFDEANVSKESSR